MAEDPEANCKQQGPSSNYKDFLPGLPTLTDFSNEGLKRVAEASRAFQSLPPAGPLWDLQKSYPEFRRAMRNCRTRIEPLIKILLEHEKISARDYGNRVVQEKLEFIVEANDDILERVCTALDDADGLFNRAEVLAVDNSSSSHSMKAPGVWGKKKTGSATTGDYRDDNSIQQLLKKQPIVPVNPEERPIKKAVHRLRVTEKPQLKFADSIDNQVGAFIPKLTLKPNSFKPLSVLPEYTTTNDEFYGHPYDVEINRWNCEEWMLNKSEPISPPTIEKTPYEFIITPEQLDTMIAELRTCKEIAVDLEHHSYRTFLGLTCLIQISSRTKDYIIDTFGVWKELQALNEIFTNPKIIKVLHGANSDLEWLQRDFGIYMVGLFDTYFAMKYLGFEQFSFQHLISYYCAFNIDKSFQLADWRLRPLSPEMIYYARQDSHFLLFIYDMLRNELLEKGNQFKNLLQAVYDQSKALCLTRYEKPSKNPQLALRKTRRGLNNRQLFAFTELYNWRDTIAREKDESLSYVLPNHMLLTIADALPKEMTGILSCCEPVPQFVHQHLGDLHRIVLKARDLPLHEDTVETIRPNKRKKQQDWMTVLSSVHDTPQDDGDIKNDNFTWPLPWIPPAGWEKLSIRANSSIPFGRATDGISNPTPNQTSPAFERYERSNSILELLRNPQKKDALDPNDPIVIAVRETLLSVIEVEKPIPKSMENSKTLESVLPQKDFVAFNPMNYAKNPGKKKRLALRSWKLAQEPPEKKPHIVTDPLPVLENLEIEDKKSISLDVDSRIPKKSKPKFLDKLGWFKKGQKRKKGRTGEQLISGASHLPPNIVPKTEPVANQARGHKKGNFFTNPFRSKEGRSITFKH